MIASRDISGPPNVSLNAENITYRSESLKSTEMINPFAVKQ